MGKREFDWRTADEGQMKLKPHEVFWSFQAAVTQF